MYRLALLTIVFSPCIVWGAAADLLHGRKYDRLYIQTAQEGQIGLP